MGMSTFVVGIRPADERYKKMLAAYEACIAAGIEPPQSVEEFFNGERPEPSGVVVRLTSFPPHACVREYLDASANSSGFEIDLDRLPDGIKILRFYNSW